MGDGKAVVLAEGMKVTKSGAVRRAKNHSNRRYGKRFQFDWDAVLSEFVTGTMSMRELAAAHGIKLNTLYVRSVRDKWADQRQAYREKASERVQAELLEQRAAEILAFNAADLKVAKAVRNKAATMLLSIQTPQDLNTVASTFGKAQTIGRLSLGMSTANEAVDAKVRVVPALDLVFDA